MKHLPMYTCSPLSHQDNFHQLIPCLYLYVCVCLCCLQLPQGRLRVLQFVQQRGHGGHYQCLRLLHPHVLVPTGQSNSNWFYVLKHTAHAVLLVGLVSLLCLSKCQSHYERHIPWHALGSSFLPRHDACAALLPLATMQYAMAKLATSHPPPYRHSQVWQPGQHQLPWLGNTTELWLARVPRAA